MSGNRASIVITSFNDSRILDLIEKLKDLPAWEIIVADGGSDSKLLERIRMIDDSRIRLLELPGSIAETRSQVQDLIGGDIAVFIDTDEIPGEGWLENITAPIIKDKSDFAFGPTKPFSRSENRITSYIDSYDQWFYENILPEDISKGPMGNSAWKSEIMREVQFNPRLRMGGEDYDFTLKAMRLGYRGIFVKEAFVYHDQSSINSLRKFVGKKFNYMIGASIAYRDNGSLLSGIGKSSRNSRRFNDPLEILVLLLKPVALLYSLIVYSRFCDLRTGKGKAAPE